MRNTATGYKRRELTAAALTANGLTIAHLPMHGSVYGADGAAAFENRSPSPAALGESLSITGTTTSIWSANAGWYTPSADSYASVKTQAAVDLFDMVNSTSVLVALNLYHTGDPSAELTLIDAASNNSAAANGGGFCVRMNTSGVVGVVGRDSVLGSSLGTNASKDVTAQTAVRIPIVFVVDCVGKTASSYFDGVFHSSSSWPGTLPQPPASWGVTIGARAATVGTFGNYAGNGANGCRISNVWIMRSTSGILLPSVAGIAADLAEAPAEIPRTLLRLLGL